MEILKSEDVIYYSRRVINNVNREGGVEIGCLLYQEFKSSDVWKRFWNTLSLDMSGNKYGYSSASNAAGLGLQSCLIRNQVSTFIGRAEWEF